MEKRVVWRGYEHIAQGTARMQLVAYSIEITAEKAARLWERLKNWKGSQQDFYFRYVNPFRLCELPKYWASKRIPIKTTLKGGKRTWK